MVRNSRSVLSTAAILAAGILVLLASGCGGGGTPAPGAAARPASGTYVAIDMPGALSTTAGDINGSGDVAGYFTDAAGVRHGFLRTSAGGVTTFDAPGAGTGTNQGTDTQDINSSDVIVGTLTDPSAAMHGYLRDPGGGFVVFDVPGALATRALAVNDSGVVTGEYRDGSGVHGFVRNPTGAITTFDAPDASLSYFGGGLVPAAINASGTVVGIVGERGFVRSANGSISTFDASGANDAYTSPADISDTGIIVGSVTPPSECDSSDPYPVPCDQLSYSFSGAGGFEMFRPPGVAIQSSGATGVNASGAVAGDYTDGNAVHHGYIRDPDGSFVVVDNPNAAETPNKGTDVNDINATGEVVGDYTDAAGVRHGFLLD